MQLRLKRGKRRRQSSDESDSAVVTKKVLTKDEDMSVQQYEFEAEVIENEPNMFIIKSAEDAFAQSRGKNLLGKRQRGQTSLFIPRKISKIVHLHPQQIVEAPTENIDKVVQIEITKPPNEISAQTYNFEDPSVK